MRIKKIELCNFGSYAGVCEFDLQANKKGNIVLIGGKNGAGKTTLFSGIKLCLYGNKAAGFENINAHYRKEVKKYIMMFRGLIYLQNAMSNWICFFLMVKKMMFM